MKFRQYLTELAIRKPRKRETFGISRDKMPQIASADYPDLLRYLEAAGAKIQEETAPARKLKPIQAEFSDPGIVKSIKKSVLGTFKSIIVSKDYRVIDGHHRWLAMMNSNPGGTVPVVRVTNMTGKKLFALILKYPRVTFKAIY